MNKIVVHKGGPGSGYHGHAGRPGKVGGSASVYAGVTASKLQEYMDYIHSIESTLINNPYGNNYFVRQIPDDHPDKIILQGLEEQERQYLEYPKEMGMTFEEFVQRSEQTFKDQLAESDVFMRITPENLQEALEEGNFENTFTSKKSGAEYEKNSKSYRQYVKARVEGEKEALGIPEDASGDERPIYGYWSKSEHGLNEVHDTYLGQYGNVSVKFNKNKIANDLTFTDSDSLDYSGRIRSSDWRIPSIMSSVYLTNLGYVLGKAEKGPDDGLYWEAQIFGKNISNVDHVYSKFPLPAALIDLLERNDIPWTIIS